MFAYPPKRAYAREQIGQDDQSERHGVLINQQNNHYRPGGTCWSVYKADGGAPHEWPLIITQVLGTERRPDIVELGGSMLFNAEYIAANGLDPDNKLPAELHGQPNVWFSSNIVWNLSSNQVYSSWSADALFVYAAAECVRKYNGETVDFTEDSAAGDVLLTSERLCFAGRVHMTKSSGKNHKKWTVRECSLFHLLSDLTTIRTVLSPRVDIYEPIMLPRCPFDPRDLIERVPRGYLLSGVRALRVGFDMDDGLWEATTLTVQGERYTARIICEEGDQTVLSLLPTTAKQVHKHFSMPALAALRATPRGDRVWHRTVGEVALTTDAALAYMKVPTAVLQNEETVLVCTPPFVPALLTLEPSESIIVAETAIVDRPVRLEALPTQGGLQMQARLREYVHRTYGKCASVAINNIRWALLNRALAVKWDTMTSVMVTYLIGFGLRNHFSLDTSGHCNVECIALNTIGFTFLCAAQILEPNSPHAPAPPLLPPLGHTL